MQLPFGCYPAARDERATLMQPSLAHRQQMLSSKIIFSGQRLSAFSIQRGLADGLLVCGITLLGRV